MIGTEKWAELQRYAVKAGAKVIAIGDDSQCNPIDAGDFFRELISKPAKRVVLSPERHPTPSNPLDAGCFSTIGTIEYSEAWAFMRNRDICTLSVRKLFPRSAKDYVED